MLTGEPDNHLTLPPTPLFANGPSPERDVNFPAVSLLVWTRIRVGHRRFAHDRLSVMPHSLLFFGDGNFSRKLRVRCYMRCV